MPVLIGDLHLPEYGEDAMNKPFRFLAILAAIGLIVAACGPSAATTAAPEATQAPAATAEAPEATEAPAATEPPAATAAAEPTAESEAEAKVLRIRANSDLSTADPAFHPASMDTMVAESVMEGLVTYQPGTWEVVNVLAEAITPSADGLTIDFKLREGIQFHDGYGELTAEDVKYSYERFLDPDLNASYSGDWAALDHVEVTGKYTGTIVLTEPFSPLWASTLPVTGGLIVSKAYVEEVGAEAFGLNPVGTGPYEFGEWRPNERVVLTRNPDYWGDAPEWDEIHLVPIPDGSAAEIAMETGEIDFGDIPLDSLERFEANDEFEVISLTTQDYSGIFLNVQHPNLQDINVRQAIRHGVDVPSIIEGVYDGRYDRACALVAPGQIGYWADAPCYERDVELARQYLADAGLDSLDVTLALIDREDSRAVAEIVQAQLAEVGINVEILVQDSGTYWDAGFGEAGLADRQLTLFDWSTTNPDPYWQTVWFTCDQVLQWNWMYWCSEEFDDLNKQATIELDPEKRAELYIQIQQLWDEAAHTVWTVHPSANFAVRKGIVPALAPNGFAYVAKFTSE
jgi:peptide/nickel transport system substrate-binding protein